MLSNLLRVCAPNSLFMSSPLLGSNIYQSKVHTDLQFAQSYMSARREMSGPGGEDGEAEPAHRALEEFLARVEDLDLGPRLCRLCHDHFSVLFRL